VKQTAFVKWDHGPPLQGAASIRTTHWTVVLTAAHRQAPEGQAAFAELFRLYWYPLYAFARRRGQLPEDAEDLTQGFFLHLLEHQVLTGVNPLKGKFRSFLLASFQNYLSNEADRARCLKRGGRWQFIPVDLESAEDHYGLEPTDALSPEQLFDARWALTLLEKAMTRLGENYMAQGQASVFETLKGFLESGADGPPSYEGAAQALGVGLGAAKTLIHRLRKRYRALLREEVARTVSDPAEVDEELHALCEALIASKGQLGP
jgi:RNA polymerase sigma factor (sigma-70 family)